MRFLNLRRNSENQIKQLKDGDQKSVTRLLRKSMLTHFHSDWRLLVYWLDTPGFVGIENQDELLSFLAVGADPLPAFWVRGAAFDHWRTMPAMLEQLLSAVMPHMQEQGGHCLAWMPIEAWVDEPIQQLGFSRKTEVVTMVTEDWQMPAIPHHPDLHIRPARTNDFTQLEAIEKAAFEPIWRYSANSLGLAFRQTFSFDVIELSGKIVGYQCSTCTQQVAHLARMTIHPNAQNQGVGTALLAETLRGYKQGNIHSVSLNTQIENVASQRLYQKFGFHPTESVVPVWVLPLKT